MSDILRYFRQDMLPHIWCPGCGHGTVTGALVRAIDKLGLSKNKVCIVSGIGCSSRAVGYLDFDTVHTAHGRAIAFATGIKLARPELKVIVMTGDGDCAAIGGNHFIHAARRNIDITTIVMNNNIYGMTSGQYSPMTPKGMYGTTAPYGNLERSFDLCELAKAAGATYVGRAHFLPRSAPHRPHLNAPAEQRIFRRRGHHRSAPRTSGGRTRSAAPWTCSIGSRKAVNVKAASSLPPEKLAGKLLIGELHNGRPPPSTRPSTTSSSPRSSAATTNSREGSTDARRIQTERLGRPGPSPRRHRPRPRRPSSTDKNAVQTRATAPRPAGGASKAEVVISDEDIDYPKAIEPRLPPRSHARVVRSYGPAWAAERVSSCVDSSVALTRRDQGAHSVLPILATASENIGKKVVANMVALGVLEGISGRGGRAEPRDGGQEQGTQGHGRSEHRGAARRTSSSPRRRCREDWT